MRLAPLVITAVVHALALAVPPPAHAYAPLAQDPYQVLDARVTAITGLSVYLDRGRIDRVHVGDRIELYPAGAPGVRAIVRSVSKTSLRAELDLPAPGLRIGDRAEIWIPEARLEAPPPDAPPSPGEALETAPGQGAPSKPKPVLPEHPPWETDLDGVDPSLPLLAPIEALEPKDRAVLITGRAWLDVSHTTDEQNAGATLESYRLGLDTTLTNAFGKGGELEFDAEFFDRSFDASDAPSESEDGMRLSRLNYLIGGDRYDPSSLQIGRFLSRGMPEFGLIDGVEWQRRTSSGNRWGAHIGALPLAKGTLETGDDVAIGVFHHWARGADPKLTFDLGYQHTLHKGEGDRDLIVFNTTWLPAPRVFVFGSAWVDIYDGSEAIKSAGPELTQFIGTATWRSEAGHGAGASVSHNKIPELLRDEYDELTAEEVLDSKVTRGSVWGWREVVDDIEVRGRLDAWKDEEANGGRVEVSTNWRNKLYADGRVELAVFQDDNKFSSGPGLRLTATKNTPKGWLRFTYETARTTNDDFFGAEETLERDVWRASWDTALGNSWDLSLNVEQRGGDAEDALTLGLFMQKRFR